jgi:hypothetical protein
MVLGKATLLSDAALRAQPLDGGRILPVEGRELPLGDGENADTDSQT